MFRGNYTRFLAAVGILWSVAGVLEPIWAQQPAGDPFVAVVTKMTPLVSLQRAGTNTPIALKQDDRLYPGDRLVCGAEGNASLIFADNAVEIKLLPNTEMVFQGQRRADGLVKRLFLQIGNLLTNVVRGDMEVVTPTCVASVKGTQWWTSVDRTQMTLVIVLDGQVQVSNPISGNVATVSAGNTATSTLTGSLQVAPTDPSQTPGSPSGPQQGSLDIEYQDGSGQTKTLHIEYDD